MQKIGFALVRIADGVVLSRVAALPCRLAVDGVGVVDFDKVGQVMPDSANPTHKIVERWGTLPPPQGAALVSEADEFDGAKVVATRVWESFAPSIDDVIAERSRRLALGFDYDFGDARGLHHIGTTPQDMEGWGEVRDASNAFIALGLPNATINIVTNTGPVTITAMEFQSILAAATAARQPVWSASFGLQAMSPIPADYADDEYWGVGSGD